ncbi:4'-phosphopantetheinyl transferase superfamily protein [Hyphomonas sp.]|uniref:4'-phosphopantetheinyl transferase family protein n=1 Tax=Hyphomonas sp. TaxID=87 RepID=UPI00352713AC
MLTASIVERRQLLACLLGRESADVLIAHDEMGKPFLPDFPDVFISFSDSEGLNGLALSRTGAVGIDVELVRPVGWEPMLSMMAEDNEAEVIRAAVAHEVEPIAFLRCWTAKEAILKAIGTGLKGGARRTRLPSAYITGETSCFSQEQDGLKLEVQTFQTGQLIVTRALAV